MKSLNENSVFGFHLLETHIQCKLNILLYKNEIELKNAFRPF